MLLLFIFLSTIFEIFLVFFAFYLDVVMYHDTIFGILSFLKGKLNKLVHIAYTHQKNKNK